jgi:hypothetical protein
VVGRARASLNPQNYAWQSLRSPLLAEDFAELSARLASLPPASLRPRYLAENLHVVPVSAVEAFEFDEANQSIELLIRDNRDDVARVHHPYLWRAREGCESLLMMLRDKSRKLCFIAGQVRSIATGLMIHPITLVFEGGATRVGVQPWVDSLSSAVKSKKAAQNSAHSPDETADPIERYPGDLLVELGELLLLGLRRADAHLARTWRELGKHGEALGYDRLAQAVLALADELSAKLSSTSWIPMAARRQALELAVLARLATDLQETS